MEEVGGVKELEVITDDEGYIDSRETMCIGKRGFVYSNKFRDECFRYINITVWRVEEGVLKMVCSGCQIC